MNKTKDVLLNYKVVQVQGNIVSDMDGEKVMLSIQNGKYYNLGEVGGVIWDKVKAPALVHNIIEDLVTEYTVEKEECQNQVLSFLEHLMKENLIEVIKE